MKAWTAGQARKKPVAGGIGPRIFYPAISRASREGTVREWALSGMAQTKPGLTLMSRTFFSSHFVRPLKNKGEREGERKTSRRHKKWSSGDGDKIRYFYLGF